MTAPSALPRKTAPSLAGRIVGIDLARLVAIVGMMAAHLIAPLGSDPAGSAIDQALGKVIGATVSSTSATTFAVLGGVSLVLLTRSMRGASAGRMLLSILIRGVVIALIGAALLVLDGPISVVLTYYGVAMIIASPALLLPSWAVGAVAGFLWLFGSAINVNLRAVLAASPQTADPDAMAETAVAMRDLLITGHYPAVTWVPYMLVGILIARMLLAAREGADLRRLCLRLAISGLALYLLITVAGRVVRMRPSWFSLPDLGERMLSSGFGAPIGTELWMHLIPTPHSGSPADMLRTVAGACFVIGALVLLFDARSRHDGLPLQTLRAAGAAPLTIYTAHVIATAALHNAALHSVLSTATGSPWYARGTAIFIVQLVGVLLIGLLLAVLHRRGPLEALLGWLSGSSGKRSAAPVLA